MTQSANAELWSPSWETMSLEALEARESSLLQEQLDYMVTRSEYYRVRLARAGLSVRDIRDRDSLSRVPFTEKQELAEYQRRGELFGPHQCAASKDIVRVVGTGGTSGLPTRLGWTQADVDTYSEMGARALWTTGVRPSDFFINCFNYSLYAGGVMDHMAFERVGAAILPFGVGNSRRLLQMLADMPGPLGLYATPSYAIRLADVALEEGIDPTAIGLEKAVFSGEAGLQLPGYREKIEGYWGMTTHALFGLAELGVQSAECEHRNGLHYSGAGLVLLEVIDSESRAPLAIEDGVIGEAVYTTLKREACPLLRYRSRDLVQVFTSLCACGRSSPRLKLLGRTDDMFVVKGVNVFPLSIQHTLLTMQPLVTGEFQVILNRPPPINYAPQLRVEQGSGAPAHIAEQVVREIRSQLGVTVEVQVVERGTIASEHKTKRVLRCYES